VKGDVPIDNKTLLMTDFVNLKIKPTQSFTYAHKYMVYMHMFIGINTHTYMSTIFILYFSKIIDPIVQQQKRLSCNTKATLYIILLQINLIRHATYTPLQARYLHTSPASRVTFWSNPCVKRYKIDTTVFKSINMMLPTNF
jgi:hypothetical protein